MANEQGRAHIEKQGPSALCVVVCRHVTSIFAGVSPLATGMIEGENPV
jgi:hypothetical protein